MMYARTARYQAAHPERVAKMRAGYLANWKANNVEHVRKYRKLHHKANPTASRDYYWANHAESKARKSEAQRRRRARMAGAGIFEVTPLDLARLLDRARNCCVYCDVGFTEANDLQWDHVLPIARGGRHSIGNLLPACRFCNQSKKDLLLMEWRRRTVKSAA